MQKKIQIKFEKFIKALAALDAIYLKPVTEDRINIDATIQRFEFTFELAVKFLKDYFLDKGAELNYPKEIIKSTFVFGLTHNESLWVQMLADRNLTSHTYNEKLADEIYGRIRDYVPELKTLIGRIQSEMRALANLH